MSKEKTGILGLCLVAVVLSGCPDGRLDVSPPTIQNVQVNPSRLRFVGGKVTIQAQVEDPSGVQKVWAVVKKPDGKEETVALSLKGGNLYEGSYDVAPNVSIDGQDQEYRVWVRAMDGKGNETRAPGEPREGVAVMVEAPKPAPEPPWSKPTRM